MIRTMDDTVKEQMQTLAERLAGEAAELSLARIGRINATRKADGSIVTETDYAIQERIVSAITQQFPDHAVLAEEHMSGAGTAVAAAEARFTWVIDPLDGTRNYVSRLPCFATSIAVLDRGTPVVGVIVEHNLRCCYAAISGRGATLDGEPIRCANPADGEDWLIGIPSSKDSLTVQVLRGWVATKGYVCRNLGSTAFHLALVASGTLVAAFAKRAKIWDVAAGVLIAAEAGAQITGAVGAELLPFDLQADANADVPFLAAPPVVHGCLLSSIQAASSGG